MARAALVAAAAVLAWVAAPGLTWLDAGELGAASWELGIAHPPGFPAQLLLHKLVMLLPLGQVAFRGALASGAMALLALWLVFLAGREMAGRGLGAHPGAALLGALLLLAAPIFWLHATTIEIYTGAAAWTAAWILWGTRLRASGDLRYLVGLLFLAGLAAGHHPELRLFVCLLLPSLALTLRRAGGWRAPLIAGAAGLLGACCLLYLPLRSLADPWRDWGNPETLSALWQHFAGTRIRLAYADRMLQPSLGDLGTFGAQLIGGSPLLVLAGLGGFVLGLRRPGGLLPPIIWALDVAYSTAINPMGLRDLQNGIAGLVALAVGAGVAFSWLAERMGSWPRRVAWVGAAGLTVALTAGRLSRPARGAADLIRAIADEAPPDALVLVASDNLAAGLAFTQVVEGGRPDLAIVVRQHVWDASSIEPVARRRPRALRGWHPGASLGALQVLSEGAWPIRWEWAGGLDAPARPPELGPVFPLFGPGLPDSGRFEQAVEARLRRWAPPPEGQGRRALARAMADLGGSRLASGRPGAVAAYRRAVEIAPEQASGWTNLGAALARRGRYLEAAEITRQALALAPGDRTAAINLIRYLIQQSSAGTPAAIEALLAAHPGDPEGLALRGVWRGNAGDLQGAARDFRAALKGDPEQPEARAGLKRLRARRRARRPANDGPAAQESGR